MTAGAIARPVLASRSFSVRDLWNRLLPCCQQAECNESWHFWRRLRHRRRHLVLEGLRCCLDSCFDRALRDRLAEVCRIPERTAFHHRVPIGLLLVARHQLTDAQLRAALHVQNAAGHGRLGEWLQDLGYASEEQVTAALARQWSCPVLRTETLELRSRPGPQIPLALMRWLAIAPVEFVDSTRTLHVAFARGLDHSVLYALEQMLECRTEPCLVRPSVLERHLEQLGESHHESQVLFEHLSDIAEFARIIRSYAACLGALEVRLTRCGSHIWVRLTRSAARHVDLIVREVRDTSAAAGSLSEVRAPAI